MQFKEPKGVILVVDRSYIRGEIAEEIALYESRGYALRSHAVYETRGFHIRMVSLIFIKNTKP